MYRIRTVWWYIGLMLPLIAYYVLIQSQTKILFGSFKIFLIFWDYNYIFPFPFLSLKPPMYPSLLSFRLMTSTFVNCYCMYICICVFISITKYGLLRLYNVTCMFSGMPIWYCKTNWCALPWGDYFSLSHHFLVPCSSLCRMRPHGLSPIHFGMSTGNHVGETSWVWRY